MWVTPKIFGVDVKSLWRTGVRSWSARFNWRTDDVFYIRVTESLGVDFLNLGVSSALDVHGMHLVV